LELGADLLAAGRAAALALHGLDELAEHEQRVAQQRIVGGVVLVEVALVVGRVDERLAGRDAGRHPVAGEAAADAENHLGPPQGGQRGAGPPPGPGGGAAGWGRSPPGRRCRARAGDPRGTRSWLPSWSSPAPRAARPARAARARPRRR